MHQNRPRDDHLITKVLAALAASILVVCSEAAIAADAPVYGPAPDWVQPVTAPDSIDADGAPFKVLLADEQIRLTPAGEEIYSANSVRVQTSQGLQALGTLQIAWQPSTDTLTVHRVHLVRDGKVIDLLAGDTRFTLIRRENNLEYSALDGILTAVLQPTDLRVGDTLEMAYTIRRNDPVLVGTAEADLGGWVQVPYERIHMRALWPRSFAVKWRATDDVKPTEQKEGDYSVVSYALDSVEPPAQSEGAPLRFAITRRVEFSSFASWRDVSSRLAPLYVRTAKIGANSPLRAEVEKIKVASKDPVMRAGAALKLVEDQIRYVYLGMNQAALVPADAETTWSRRFGDCKAKTVLLLALLHELNIDGEPVVVSTTAGDLVGGILPSVSTFDHVLVRAHIGGHTYWLDGTRNGDRGLETLHTPNFRSGLPLTEKGSELVPIVADPLSEPSVDTSITIDASAGILAPAPFHVAMIERGDSAIADRNRLAALPAESLDRTLRKFWTKAYPTVDVTAVEARYDATEGKEILTMDGSSRMLWKDGWYATDGLGVGYEADFTRSKGADTKPPYAVSFPLYVHSEEKIILPPKQPFTTSGNDVDQTVAGMEVRRHAHIDLEHNTFYGEASGRSVVSEFPADQAPSAQAALRAMANDGLYLREPVGYMQTPADLAGRLSVEPTTANGFIERGNGFLNAGNYDQAIADFSKALELNPKADMALADRGITYAQQHKGQLAMPDLDSAEKLNPKNPVPWRARGLLAAQAGNFDQAIAEFSKSLELEPGNVFALNWRTYSYEKAGKWNEALADVTEVILKQPTAHSYETRAEIYANQGQNDQAIADALKVSALPGGGPLDYSHAAGILSRYGKRAEALQAYDVALKQDPKPATYVARAYAREDSDLDGRLSDLDAALSLAPGMNTALTAKALFEFQAGKFHEAALASTAAMVSSYTPQVLIIRAAAYDKTGQKENSAADIEAAKKLAEGSVGKLNNLCWDLAVYGLAYDDALAACDAALALAPGVPQLLDSRGLVLLRLGRLTDAIADYGSALEKRPNSSSSLYGRGLARVRAGDAVGAQADLAAATAIDADVASRYAKMGLSPN